MKFYVCFPNALLHCRKAIPNTIRMMKLVSLMMLMTCLQVSASLYAQRVTLVVKDQPLVTIFTSIEKQTDYQFWYTSKHIENAKKVTLNLKNTKLILALEKIFENQSLTYELVNKSIVVRPKEKPAVEKIRSGLKKQIIHGTVNDETGEPLVGATVRVKGTDRITTTNKEGKFTLTDIEENAILLVSYIGYQTQEVLITSQESVLVKMEATSAQLNQVSVVSTGYQTLPKERATGSFVQIDNTLLNRRVGTTVLDRLDGVASGIIFNKASGTSGILPRNEKLGIAIRGRVTIDDKVSADPLIILDNFPYEGNVNNINPNDIESITVLKDAAAASIWGARSGNGVIVMTTKKGLFNQPLKIDLNSNITMGSRPNLKYSRNFISSSDFVDAETDLFNKGYYDYFLGDTDYYPVISPVVELLAKQKNDPSNTLIANQIDAYRSIDVRDDASKYLYQKSRNQQYSISLRGGSDKTLYFLSLGYDQNRNSVVGSDNGRLTINVGNTYRPIKNLELNGSVIYTDTKNDNGYGYTSPFPYVRLADSEGNALSVPYSNRTVYLDAQEAKGFLDWKYRPIDERNLNDNTTKGKNILLRGSVKYNFKSFLNAEIQYQYENENNNTRIYTSPEGYQARNNVNRYTQIHPDGSLQYPYPKGGMLFRTHGFLNSNNLRTQLNFNKVFGQKHTVTAIAGAELREIVTESSNHLLLGYDEKFGTAVSNLNYNIYYPVNPSALGSAPLPSIPNHITGTTNRYVSYYANGAYTFIDRYTFSLSGRKDGANIFGVRTNDKMTPLWSAGLSYELSKEPFYNFNLIPYLKVRASYGYNGNVYNGSAYLTASYDISPINGIPIARIVSAPNAELRWEKIRNKNLAVDFASKNNRISGSVEIYEKLGEDLIEDARLAASTGFSTYKGNSATVKTSGVDITLHTTNTIGWLKWQTSLLLSYNKDKVISYDTKYASNQLTSTANNDNGGLFIMEGNSLFGVYSFRSAGLDPANGDPRGFLDGQMSKDYTAILNNSKLSDIVYHGSSRPTHFGYFRNSLSYRGLTLSLNVFYKFNYYFKKKSIDLNYSNLLAANNLNADYKRRWQKPGDEMTGDVPSLASSFDYSRNIFYQGSESLVEKADHIRLQDITLNYRFSEKQLKKLPFASLEVYSYINNVGILWKANKEGIDPDVSEYSFAGYNSYPNPRTVSLGIRTTIK